MHPVATLIAAAAAGPENILVAIEVHDENVPALLSAQCSSWIRHFPRGHVRAFSDTAVAVPAPCAKHRVTVHECCPGNASLGRSLSTAQYKREQMHMTVARMLSQDSWHSEGVRWILSTEQDVWWDVGRLTEFLSAVEAAEPSVATGEAHALVGSWMGPFILMNRAMAKRLGDRGTLDACRAKLLRCKAKFTAHKCAISTKGVWNKCYISARELDECDFNPHVAPPKWYWAAPLLGRNVYRGAMQRHSIERAHRWLHRPQLIAPYGQVQQRSPRQVLLRAPGHHLPRPGGQQAADEAAAAALPTAVQREHDRGGLVGAGVQQQAARPGRVLQGRAATQPHRRPPRQQDRHRLPQQARAARQEAAECCNSRWSDEIVSWGVHFNLGHGKFHGARWLTEDQTN